MIIWLFEILRQSSQVLFEGTESMSNVLGKEPVGDAVLAG